MFQRRFFSSLSIAAVLAVGMTGTIVSPAVAAPEVAVAAAAAPAPDLFEPAADAAAGVIPASNPPTSGWQPQAETRLAPVGGDAERAPVGTAVGKPGLGALPFFSFETIELSYDTVARVNLGNGNLLMTANDGTLSGPGLSLRNDRFYNGLSSRDGSFGGGWLSALLADDVGLQVNTSTAVFVGPSGISQTFVKNGTAYVAPAGFNAALVKNANDFTLTYNKTGEKLTFSLTGFLLSDKDRNGQGVTYTYVNNKVVSAYQSSGRHIDVTYAASGKVSSMEDSSGRTITYVQNAAGELSNVGSGRETFTYDSTGRMSEARFVGTGGFGDTATMQRVVFTYDAAHRVTAIKRGVVGAATFLSTTTFAYTTTQTTVTNPNGQASVYTIDGEGRVSSAKDPLNRTRAQTWTANSDIATTTDGFASGGTGGNQSTLAYDALNNATSTTLPTGAAASAAYATGVDCAGTGGTAFQPKCSTDPSGAKKKYDYDTAGNTLATTDTTTGGTGAITQRFTYQGTGGVTCGGFTGQVCTATDGNNNVTTNLYDVDGNLTKVTPPAPQGTTEYTYDSLGRVKTVKDGKGQVTSYGYNTRDQLVLTTFVGASFTQYYYATGLESQQSDSATGVKDKTYNVLGRLTSESAPGFSASYVYDPAGNLTSYTDGGGTIGYVYDAANQLTRSIDPGGTCQAAAGSAADSGCVKYEYNVNGAETKRTTPGNATITTTVDNAGRATRITARNSAAAVVADVGYSYTIAGGTGPTADRTAIQTRTSFLEVGIPAGAVTSYGYDSLNRVTAATEKNGATAIASWAYAYDAAGNRTQQIRAGTTGAAVGTIGYTYNAANRLASTTADTTTWTYDGAGNQTRNGITGQTSTVNSRSAVSAIGATTYTAFGAGNTDQLTRSTSTTAYTNTALGLTREQLAGGLMRNFTRTSTGDAVSTRLNAGVEYYYIKDALGSVIGLLDQTGAFAGGYAYSPYGETRNTITAGSATDKNSLRYIAGYFDRGSGLYKLGARYYDPTTGRFTQYDPSGQEANPYSYANGNPVNFLDPTGLVSISLVVTAIDAILTGKSIYDVLTNTDLLTFASSAGAEIACNAAVAAPTAGIGLAVSFGFCALFAEVVGAAVNNIVN